VNPDILFLKRNFISNAIAFYEIYFVNSMAKRA